MLKEVYQSRSILQKLQREKLMDTNSNFELIDGVAEGKN